MCTMCVPGALREQKKASDPLEPELQMIRSRHMGAGSWTQVLYKSILLTAEALLKPFCLLLNQDLM